MANSDTKKFGKREMLLDTALTDPRIEGFLYRLSNELPDSMKEPVERQMGTASSNYFENLVQGAVRRGEIRDDLPVDFISRISNTTWILLRRA